MSEQNNQEAVAKIVANMPEALRTTLLPCPFCGSQEVDPAGHYHPDGRPTPKCKTCGATADNVISWNTRGSPEKAILTDIAKTLAAYALNVAYGQELQVFELANLKSLAGILGCRVEPQHVAFEHTRRILAQILKERRKQVEQLGFTSEHDERNPGRLREQVLERVQAMPTEHEVHNLTAAAAIIVAELEMLDKRARTKAEAKAAAEDEFLDNINEHIPGDASEDTDDDHQHDATEAGNRGDTSEVTAP